MSQLESLAERYRGDGAPARELLRDDREWVVCFSCPRKHGRNVRHPLRSNNADHDYQDFACRHLAAEGHIVVRLGPKQMERIVRRAERRRKRLRQSERFLDNATVLEAFQSSDQTMDLTSFNSLASSATAGWSSTYIDNTSNLYLDYLFAVALKAVNTAPGSDQYFYFFAAASLNTTDRPATGASSGICANSSSTAAALTFPSISTTPPVFPYAWKQPYNTQNVAQQSPIFSYARALGGWPGLYNWLPALNFSGMAIAADTNSIKYRGVYNTVA